jgi:FG-GAP repeat
VSRAGDVNADGIDDLIVGARLADPTGRDAAGASYVVSGAMDLSGIINLATDADLIIRCAAPDDNSGEVRGAGDVNGDKIADLLIGALFADPNGRTDAGAGYLVFGTDQGFPPPSILRATPT